MEGLEVLCTLLLIVVIVCVFVLPVVALVKASGAARQAEIAEERIRELELRAGRQERQLEELARRTGAVAPAPASPPEVLPVVPQPVAVPAEPSLAEPAVAANWMAAETTAAIPEKTAAAPESPPPLPPAAAAAQEFLGRMRGTGGPAPASSPPPAPLPRAAAKPPVSLEQFMGVKLFAWLGGIALFFGVIFFVKYAFENNLIRPAVRVALGFVTGAGLLVGGLWTQRKANYRVLAESLCATAILILYGVTYAAHAVYALAAFGQAPTFALMSLITVAAFLVAVRLDALVVAALGILGGFLTPVLLPTGHDNPLGLFGYVALLDLGLLAVTWRGRWTFLAAAAATGTVLMEILWFGKFFVVGRYFEGAQTLVPMGILCFFCALFLAVAWWAPRQGRDTLWQAASALGLGAVAMVFAFVFLGFPDIAQRTFLLYGFVLLLNLAVLAVTVIQPKFAPGQVFVAAATFLHLAFWTGSRLRPEMLGGALASYLVFGGLHAAWPVALERLRPGGTANLTRQTGLWFPLFILFLMLLPVLVLPEVSLLLWAAILLVDLLVVGLAVLSGAILPVLASLGMTLVIALAWLFRVPCQAASLPPFLWVVTFFAVFFAAAGLWLAKRPMPALANGQAAKLLPVFSGSMPFVLLILAVMQLPVANPSPVFGVGLLLAVLLLGLAVLGRQAVLAPVALVCALALQAVWHQQRFDPASPWLPLAWYLVFYAVFSLFPFVFRKACADCVAPWAASALAGGGAFLLVHHLMRHAFPNGMMGHAFPNGMMGLVPAAFAVPAILALLAVRRTMRVMDRPTQARLAWFGGIALFFITLIFPIQFDRQWLTVSWALEGACLLWLFRRVPHPGLLGTGLVLLGASFFRLTFNPAVFEAYPRSGTRILNWHLYAYGLVAAAQFLAACWLTAERSRFKGLNLRVILWTFGGFLLFLLLNIEVADFFTPSGDRFVAFRFAGNFARDMTYTITWGLFALGLLVIGIWRHARGARYAAIGLLVLTLLKLFVHDLATIHNIYRIGALIGVAVIAFLASFLYQRFYAQAAKP